MRWLLCALLVGCYQRPGFDDCTIRCTDDVCPSGMGCVAGMCTSGDSCTPAGVDGGIDAAAPLCAGTSSTPTVALGARHTCVLDGTGDLYCFGDNGDGQVGAGSAATVASPARVGDCWTAVAVGAEHTCALDAQGAVWCWGNNTSGQVDGDSTADAHARTYAAPVQVKFPASHPAFARVAAGGAHSCAIGVDGSLWCWGSPAALVGSASVTAQQIGADLGWTMVSLGADHACGLDGGAVTCFGANAHGQIDASLGVAVTAPTAVAIAAGAAVVISAGDEATCAIVNHDASAAGQLVCWGDASQLDPDATGVAGQTAINADTTWTAVRVGHTTACGIDAGQIVCWGDADHGGLGDGLWGQRKVAAAAAPAIAGVSGATAIDVGISASNSFSEHACALAGGQVTCWGQNVWGEGGIGAASRAASPVAAADVGKTWTKLAGGHDHLCALASDRTLWCWGQNGQGQITADDRGAGDSAPCVAGGACDYAVPTQIPAGAGDAFDDAVGGDDFTCAFVAADAAIRCWGRYQDGALGIAGTASHAVTTVPVTPSGSNHGGWTGITGGDRGVCGLTAIGDPPECWGHLPSGTQAAPKALGLTAHTFVFADDSAGGTSGGARVVWGADDVDQLGTSQTYPAPGVLAGDTDTAMLAASGKHACKLTTAGAIECFGSNASGESGLPAGDPANTDPAGAPNPIAGLAACTSVSVAADHSCAVCGGAVSCWGSNKSGLLGRGADTSDPPQQAVAIGIANATSVAATTTGGCALDAAGELWCWGVGDRGELANGGHDLAIPTTIVIP